jgi:hypothetical protein
VSFFPNLPAAPQTARPKVMAVTEWSIPGRMSERRIKE